MKLSLLSPHLSCVTLAAVFLGLGCVPERKPQSRIPEPTASGRPAPQDEGGGQSNPAPSPTASPVATAEVEKECKEQSIIASCLGAAEYARQQGRIDDAVIYLKKSCENIPAPDYRACVQLGDIFADVKKEKLMAIEYYGRGCVVVFLKGGKPPLVERDWGCARASALLQEEARATEGQRFLTLACALGSTQAQCKTLCPK